MPKKMTEEEKKAWGAKMKAAREAKKTKEDIKVEPSPEIQSDTDVSELLKRVKELESKLTQNQQPQVTAQGMIGTLTKYSLDPNKYPDPITRLANEARLKRFAFEDNYELKFDMTTVAYETRNGVNTEEPKFELQLIGKVFDEAGEPTNKRYIMRKLIFFEDPQAALTIARDNNLEIDQSDEDNFLNEMRYLRMRDWLMDLFYPKPANPEGRKREEVIGNTLVEVYEISSETPKSIPFDQIKKG